MTTLDEALARDVANARDVAAKPMGSQPNGANGSDVAPVDSDSKTRCTGQYEHDTRKTQPRDRDDLGWLVTPTIRIRQIDEYNFGLESRVVVGNGVHGRWHVVGYYSSLRSAVEALVERHVHLLANLTGDARAVLAELDRVRRDVLERLSELGHSIDSARSSSGARTKSPCAESVTLGNVTGSSKGRSKGAR